MKYIDKLISKIQKNAKNLELFAQSNLSVNKYPLNDLNDWVLRIDELGGIASPAARDFTRNFNLDFSYDDLYNMDPYSDAYRQKQIAAYELFSGRSLNQKINEHTVVPDNRNSANPYGSRDISFISKHSRTI